MSEALAQKSCVRHREQVKSHHSPIFRPVWKAFWKIPGFLPGGFPVDFRWFSGSKPVEDAISEAKRRVSLEKGGAEILLACDRLKTITQTTTNDLSLFSLFDLPLRKANAYVVGNDPTKGIPKLKTKKTSVDAFSFKTRGTKQ